MSTTMQGSKTGKVAAIITLTRFDLLQSVRERGTWLLMAAMLLLSTYAVWQGATFTKGNVAAAASANAQATRARDAALAYATRFFAEPNNPKHLAERSFRNVADIRGYALREHIAFATKPTLPGAAFAIGQADLLPSYVRVRAESMDSVRQSSDIEHPRRLAIGRFDLMFVVLYLWPLALLGLCLSALTADRELRRIDALKLQGISEAQLLTAQLVGRGFVATLCFALITLLVAFLSGALSLSAAGVAAGMAWAFVLLAYSVFWLAVAAAIACMCRTRMTAAFAGFGAWVALTVLIPQLLGVVAASVYPMPSRERHLLEVREAVDRVNADRLKLIERFYDQHPQWRPQVTALNKVSPPVMRLARAAELESRLADADAKFEQTRREQAQFLALGAFLSPVTLVGSVLEALAGNDAARHAVFLDEVRRYQLSLRAHFQSRLQEAALAEEQSPCQHPSTTCLRGFGFTGHAEVPVFASNAALATTPAVGIAVIVTLTLWCALLGFLVRRRLAVQDTKSLLQRDPVSA
jgi:ABC-2 type transport system permease protein